MRTNIDLYGRLASYPNIHPNTNQTTNLDSKRDVSRSGGLSFHRMNDIALNTGHK